MKKTLCVILVFISLFGKGNLFAQTTKDLYIPYEICRAYQKEYRSYDGKPARNYFQNTADYSIHAEFFPTTNVLEGTEIITYKNNSHDTLSKICINLYQNLYKKGMSRAVDIQPVNIHDGVDVKSLKVNGLKISSDAFHFTTTIVTVDLIEKILPLTVTKIEIEWKQKMPVTAVERQGTYHETSFFIAYWYPKICVYDDIDGWNTIGHNGIAEFYSDFGNFNVEITVAAAYNVWSSGILENPSEIFTDKYAARIKRASVADDVIHIITEADRKENRITQSGKKHSWKFKSEAQADFAFGVSNTYLWDAGSVEVEGRRIPVNSVYDVNAKYYYIVTELSKRTIAFFSTKTPGIAFPYSQLTAFQGCLGGMEFPGMINDNDFDNDVQTAFVCTHEIAHAYFPFNVGINEQKYGWMDEGLAYFLGNVALADLVNDKNTKILAEISKNYNERAGRQALDVPLMTLTYNLNEESSSFVTYDKSASAFYLIYDYLGKEKFYQAIREFTENWKGKHPLPYDLFFTFNKIAGEDLAWFWKPWFFEYGVADLGIAGSDINKDETIVHIEKNGNYPVPIVLTVKYKDGSTNTFRKGMDVWKSGAKIYDFKLIGAEIKEIILNQKMIPDADDKNNRKVF